MNKKMNFTKGLLAVLLGVIAGLSLAIKVFGGSWWQVVIGIFVGGVVGLLVVDHRFVIRTVKDFILKIHNSKVSFKFLPEFRFLSQIFKVPYYKASVMTKLLLSIVGLFAFLVLQFGGYFKEINLSNEISVVEYFCLVMVFIVPIALFEALLDQTVGSETENKIFKNLYPFVSGAKAAELTPLAYEWQSKRFLFLLVGYTTVMLARLVLTVLYSALYLPILIVVALFYTVKLAFKKVDKLFVLAHITTGIICGAYYESLLIGLIVGSSAYIFSYLVYSFTGDMEKTMNKMEDKYKKIWSWTFSFGKS